MKKSNVKKMAVLALMATALAGCGNLNNARLAIGGDAIEIDAYSQGVLPSYEMMGKNTSFSLSSSEATVRMSGTFEKISGDSSSTITVDLDFANYSFVSAFINASDYVPEESSSSSSASSQSDVVIDDSQKGVLSTSYEGYLSYEDSSGYSYLERNGSNSLKATMENGEVTSSIGSYEAYRKVFTIPILPEFFSFSSLYSRLLFLSPASDPLITSSLLQETNSRIVNNATSLRDFEEELEFSEEILTVSSFGDNVYGVGIYMDKADYASLLSSYKEHYLLTGTEESWMRRYGNYYEKLNMNRFAISQVNNANGIVDFGFNINCSLETMDDYLYLDDGSSYKVTDLDVDIEVVYNLSQGSTALNTYNSLAL